jgi:hypothetical protein
VIFVASGIFGGLPLGGLIGIVGVALVGTLMLLGRVRGKAFDPVSIESLWARYGNLPYNPWRIVRDRAVVPHPLWEAHVAWARDLLKTIRLPRIPWHWEQPRHKELVMGAVVILALLVGPGQIQDITGPLGRIEGVTQAPSFEARLNAPEILGLPAQTVGQGATLSPLPVGSTVTVAFPKTQRIIPYVAVGNETIRLITKDTQTWQGILEKPVSGPATLHFGFISVPLGSLSVVSDQPPNITWRGRIQAETPGALTLSYGMQDDFGIQVVSAHGRLVDPKNVAAAFRGPETWDVLVLDQPPYPVGGKDETSVLDVSGAYAAGYEVDLSLSARDAMGQMGESGVQRVILPPPTYRHPVAGALYQMRADLIAGGDMKQALPILSEPLSRLPLPKAGTFLALKAMTLMLQRGAEDDRRAVVDLLWGVIQDLEPQASLKDAQTVQSLLDQLGQSLDNPAQRAAVMQKLRESLQKYFQQLQTMMKQQGLMPENSQFDLAPLDALLKRLEDAAQYGDPQKAAEMVEQLKKMMQGMPKSPADLAAMKALQKSMQDLGKLSEQQAQLMKDVDDPNRPPQDTTDAKRQEALKTELNRLQQEFSRFGLTPPSLGKADEAMAGAVEALKQGSPVAPILMRQALEALNESLNQAMEQLQEQGRFTPMGMASGGEGSGIQGQDPEVTIPDDKGSARLRQILDVIRDRVNNEEGTTRDYLQNLLRGE